MVKIHDDNETFSDNDIKDYTENGICSNCAGCCSSILPITQAEIRNIKKYMRKNNIKVVKKRLPTINLVIDMTCPLLIGNKCSVYEVRPSICREFTCEKFKNGTKIPENIRESWLSGQFKPRDLRHIFKED